MTRKERKLLQCLAAGMTLQEAATAAGYNLKYAQKKAAEPAFMDALKLQRQAQPAKKAGPVDPKQALEEIITDPSLEPGQKVSAVRALIMYLEKKPAETRTPIIIDDIPNIGMLGPEDCAGCIWKTKAENMERILYGQQDAAASGSRVQDRAE